jgi:hypothetical protein
VYDQNLGGVELHHEKAMSLLERLRLGLEVPAHWLKHLLRQWTGHPDVIVEVCEAVLIVDPELPSTALTDATQAFQSSSKSQATVSNTACCSITW